MTRRTLALVQLVLAAAFLCGTVVVWGSTSSVETAAPVAAGEPSMPTTVYHPGFVMLALTLATIAGVFAVFGLANARRR